MKSVEEILVSMKASGMADEAGNRLRIDEIAELFDYRDDPFKLISAAFNLGYYRGTKSERYKQRKRKNRN